MAREIERLSPLSLKALPPGRHCDGDGLYLQVTASKDGKGLNRSWIFKYPMGGRMREMGLGPLHRVGLAQARKTVAKFRETIGDGADPIEARRELNAAKAIKAAKTVSFWEAAEGYLRSDKSEAWANRQHAAEWRRSLEVYAKPILGSLPVAAIDTALVLKVLEQEVIDDDGRVRTLWTLRRQTADRLRGRLEKILDAAKLRGLRTGENPARWRGHLEHSLTKVTATTNHRALPFADLPAFMAALRSYANVEARALEFLILTAARTGEVLLAKWEEVDRSKRLWIVPAKRMKAKKEHQVPLCDRALEILDEMKAVGEGTYVFPGKTRSHLRPTALYEFVLNTLKRSDDLTVHGFRSTFRTWAGECTSFDRETIEQSLAHAIGNAVERAYARGNLIEKRRRLMEAWADYANGRVPADGNVIAFATNR
jgi:integrase